jgi:fibronectin type 3 domain-containing protein
VALNGTGTSAAQHQVDLNWSAPSNSPVPASGYNILRSTGGGAYQVMNSSVNTPTTYVDTKVQGGTTYSYEVESVDSAGIASSPSSEVTVTVP